MNYEDIKYDKADGIATIKINRPEVYNAFRAQTVVELIDAFQDCGWDKSIGVIVLTGAGDKAFSTGGDQSADSKASGSYGELRGTIGMPINELQSLIRDVPKPVIARVQGYAGMESLRLYYDTEESKEGGNAFREKRKPDFRKYVK